MDSSFGYFFKGYFSFVHVFEFRCVDWMGGSCWREKFNFLDVLFWRVKTQRGFTIWVSHFSQRLLQGFTITQHCPSPSRRSPRPSSYTKVVTSFNGKTMDVLLMTSHELVLLACIPSCCRSWENQAERHAQWLQLPWSRHGLSSWQWIDRDTHYKDSHDRRDDQKLLIPYDLTMAHTHMHMISQLPLINCQDWICRLHTCGNLTFALLGIHFFPLFARNCREMLGILLKDSTYHEGWSVEVPDVHSHHRLNHQQ